MIVLTPPASFPVWGPQVWWQNTPKLKTDFYRPNWCLSLADAFWGLRRVKYVWIQHGWLNLLKKKHNNKQMTWNLYLAETNRIRNRFSLSGNSAGALAVYSICCSVSSEAEIQSHLPRTHSRPMHNPSHVCIYIHICSVLSTGWRGDKPLDRHRDPSFKFIH